MHVDLHHPQELPKGHTLGLGVVKCGVRLRFRGSSYLILIAETCLHGTQDTCVAPLEQMAKHHLSEGVVKMQDLVRHVMLDYQSPLRGLNSGSSRSLCSHDHSS